MINPDLKQNIFYAVFFTVTHNALALFYFMGIVFAVGLSLFRPSRKSVLLLVGFSLLLFGFEYNKHIVEGLREQTLNALITVQEHNFVRRIVNVFTLRLFPIMFPLGGWSLVLLSGLLYFKRHKIDKHRPKE
ncbi:hypothetical protein COY90_00870 [Candidatus Roizmanbacteria bacterium CG_4_10_14_0_8_um_filter_39_9]|uniref:DUF2784 domain-containing protein n=1 Tax=Candidatus Roizmanbacteria bacterium CG_4_10_14_0_8_um_filter_39_9 TaxID=1974829 RepID=A0A2M7QDV0_9BACT|nr:MAG: hypothetical protein COY90_00870 [Candidatus Roizmanbacteria bacterium CG_4_10_14_0_8_um_filter_39_9]